ncbi:NAD(P)H-dependent oxidoreductase [Thermodesulfobacteriota bacterium]
MNILIILAHPDSNSFNHSIAEAAVNQVKKNGHTVLFNDLYLEKFDPLLPSEEIPSEGILPSQIEEHCKELKVADGIIIIHPNWWGQPPAILKGWIDRVLRPDIAYRFLEGDKGEGVPEGLLKAETAIVFNTANTPPEREQDVFGDPLQLLWKNCIFDLCGVREFYREIFAVIVTSSDETRKKWLSRVTYIVSRYFPPMD